jgi:COP9 signalosome complex subunit 4
MTEMQVRALVQQIDDLFRGPEASSKAKLRETINKITNAEVSIAKPAMLHLARVSTHEMSDDLFKETSEMALAAISEQHMHSVYDESDNIFRTRLFDILIAEEKFSDAADVLGQLNLDSQIYIYSADEKANIHIKCAESFLEEEESVRAEGHIDRIHREDIMSEVVDQILTLRYKVTHARVLDANRRFVEASRRYFDVSSTKEAGLNQDDLIELLSKAVTCAILGKIGPQHTRLIRVLSKDERLPQLEMVRSKFLLDWLLPNSIFTFFVITEKLTSFHPTWHSLRFQHTSRQFKY